MYVDHAENRNYENMVLFSVNGVAMENFISAQGGSITNQAGVFSLDLHNGASYIAESDEFKKVVFNQMNIRTQVGEAPLSGYDLIEYWNGAFDGSSSTTKRRFAKAILISLFPLVSVFLIPLIGVANPRFHKNFSYFYVIGATLLYYVLVHILAGEAPFIALFAIPTLWWIGTYWLYSKQIKSIY